MLKQSICEESRKEGGAGQLLIWWRQVLMRVSQRCNLQWRASAGFRLGNGVLRIQRVKWVLINLKQCCYAVQFAWERVCKGNYCEERRKKKCWNSQSVKKSRRERKELLSCWLDGDMETSTNRVSQRCNVQVLATSFKSGLGTSNNNELEGTFLLLEKLEIRIIR